MRLVVDGRGQDLQVRSAKDGVEVVVKGRAQRLDVRGSGRGSFVLTREGGSQVFHCGREGDLVHLFWNGRPYELRLEREGARAAQRHAAGGLEAPMPGRVIKLAVAVGDHVKRG